MAYDRLVFRVHAARRMVQRHVDEQAIRHVLRNGEVIEDYPDDIPYPSYLILGFCGARPIHLVAADNHQDQETIIITVYEPDPAKWGPGFKVRRKSS